MLERSKLPPGELLSSERAEEAAYECTLCGRCDALCPLGLPLAKGFLETRAEAFKRGNAPLAHWRGRMIFQWLGASPLLRGLYLPERCDIVLFPGCNLAGLRPAQVLALREKLSERIGPLGVALDCCGVSSLQLGDDEGFREMMARFGRRLRERGVKKLISACPSCNATFAEHLEGFSVESVFNHLDGLVEAKPEREEKVILHQPCSARTDEAYEFAVGRLAKAAGLKTAKPEESALSCCIQVVGSGDAGAIFPAGRVVTSCAGCMQTLSARVETRHILDYVFKRSSRHLVSVPRQLLRRWLLKLKLKKAVSRSDRPRG